MWGDKNPGYGSNHLLLEYRGGGGGKTGKWDVEGFFKHSKAVLTFQVHLLLHVVNTCLLIVKQLMKT